MQYFWFCRTQYSIWYAVFPLHLYLNNIIENVCTTYKISGYIIVKRHSCLILRWFANVNSLLNNNNLVPYYWGDRISTRQWVLDQLRTYNTLNQFNHGLKLMILSFDAYMHHVTCKLRTFLCIDSIFWERCVSGGS